MATSIDFTKRAMFKMYVKGMDYHKSRINCGSWVMPFSVLKSFKNKDKFSFHLSLFVRLITKSMTLISWRIQNFNSFMTNQRTVCWFSMKAKNKYLIDMSQSKLMNSLLFNRNQLLVRKDGNLLKIIELRSYTIRRKFVARKPVLKIKKKSKHKISPT